MYMNIVNIILAVTLTRYCIC